MRTRLQLEDIELTSHEQYIDILYRLRKLTRYIVIVQTLGENKHDLHIDKAYMTMKLLSKKKTRKWFMTQTCGKPAVEYIFEKDNSFFVYLTSLESFFFSHYSHRGEYRPIWTDFGIDDDISFLDKDRQVLFGTCTHEGMAMIHPDVMKVDITYLDRSYLQK